MSASKPDDGSSTAAARSLGSMVVFLRMVLIVRSNRTIRPRRYIRSRQRRLGRWSRSDGTPNACDGVARASGGGIIPAGDSRDPRGVQGTRDSWRRDPSASGAVGAGPRPGHRPVRGRVQRLGSDPVTRSERRRRRHPSRRRLAADRLREVDGTNYSSALAVTPNIRFDGNAASGQAGCNTFNAVANIQGDRSVRHRPAIEQPLRGPAWRRSRRRSFRPSTSRHLHRHRESAGDHQPGGQARADVPPGHLAADAEWARIPVRAMLL